MITKNGKLLTYVKEAINTLGISNHEFFRYALDSKINIYIFCSSITTYTYDNYFSASFDFDSLKKGEIYGDLTENFLYSNADVEVRENEQYGIYLKIPEATLSKIYSEKLNSIYYQVLRSSYEGDNFISSSFSGDFCNQFFSKVDTFASFFLPNIPDTNIEDLFISKDDLSSITNNSIIDENISKSTKTSLNIHKIATQVLFENMEGNINNLIKKNGSLNKSSLFRHIQERLNTDPESNIQISTIKKYINETLST